MLMVDLEFWLEMTWDLRLYLVFFDLKELVACMVHLILGWVCKKSIHSKFYEPIWVGRNWNIRVSSLWRSWLFWKFKVWFGEWILKPFVNRSWVYALSFVLIHENRVWIESVVNAYEHMIFMQPLRFFPS